MKGMPEKPTDAREGFVDRRFKDPLPPPMYGIFGSCLSILSLVVMTASAVYMAGQLSDPSTAFYRLIPTEQARIHLFKPPRPVTPHGANSFGELIHDLPCFFPGVPYDLNKPTDAYGQCSTRNSHAEHREGTTYKAALWTLLPFYFTIWGAGLGAAFEIYLLLTGKPFQQMLNPLTTWVSRLRLLNLPFVNLSIFFYSVCMTAPKDNATLLLFSMYFSVFLAFALAPALYFGGLVAGGFDFTPPTLLAIQGAQLIFVLARGVVFGGSMATLMLALAPVFQIAAFLVTTATPIRSFAFHVLSSMSGIFLYVALELGGNEAPLFPIELQAVLLGPSSTHIGPFLVAAAVFGVCVMLTFAPKVYQNARSEISYIVWSLIYYILVGNPSQPRPYRLGTIYNGQSPERITLQPYGQQHPYDMSPNLGIPAIRGELPLTTETNAGSLLQKVTKLFGLISKLDYFIPQADVDASIEYKPRMAVNDDGQDQYPSDLFSSGLMKQFPDMGKTLQRCPEPAIDAFKEGELLAWLCQYGIGNSFLKRAKETSEYPYYKLVEPSCDEPNSGYVMDFRKLEAYEYKEDYEPYGGVAFFTIDENKNLQVAWLVTPRETSKVLFKKKNQAYRRAEAMIASSLYFSVIAGKHLAEIHMTYNLLEVVANNAFDVKLNAGSGNGGYIGHPVRLYLYIHLFSHGLAEELTTEHLVQKGAVFSQIFALKYESLCDYLSREYNDFTFASDEDFETRKELMKPLQKTDETLDLVMRPFSTSLDWEMEYFDIFHSYATRMTEAIYGKGEEADNNVRNDEALQGFLQEMECVFNKMPERYDGFQTVKGVIRFLADTTNHLVIRHQFYGTTAVAAAMDPRLGSTQVPKDGGPPAVDEWRSLAFVALATAYANFVHIIEDPNEYPDSMEQRPLQDIFDDASPVHGGPSQDLVSKMKRSWQVLQHDLERLNDQWLETDTHHKYGVEQRVSPTNWKTDVNYMYCRPLPQDLHTGPGY